MFFPVFSILSKIETLQYFVVVFELQKLALKFIWECKKSRIAKVFLKNIKVMINKTELLVQRQTNTPMEKNTKPRNRPTGTQTLNLQQR